MKIESIDTFPVHYPTVGRFKFFEGPKGEPLGRPALLIKITADDGTFGWGESVPSQRWSYETLESVTSTVRHYFVPILIGHDVFDLTGIHHAMNAAIAPGFTTGMPIAKAGIDIALHDLIGKTLHCSLAELWGCPAGKSLTLSWTLNPASLDNLDRSIDEGWQKGYRNFNVKVAPDPAYDLELCRRVKERVPDGFLWADANGGYDLATAKRIIQKLADLGVAVLEAPLRPNEIFSYRELKRLGALPIIMDEGVMTPRDLIEFLRLDMLDGLAMKPGRTSGLYLSRQMLDIVENAGLIFLGSGLSDPDVSLSASLALYSAYGLKYPAALNGPQFLGHSVLSQPLVPKDGQLEIPKGPGLGIEVDEAKIHKILVDL